MNLIRTRRPLAVLFAATLTAASLAGCGALTSSKDEGNPSNSATASSAQPSDAPSPAPTTAPAPGPVTSTPAPPNPGSSGGAAPQPAPPTNRGGADVGSLRGIPESAKATLDPAPLTQEERQRGRELPLEVLSTMVSGDTAGACDLLVVEENGEYVRFDRPEVRDLCVTELEREVESSSLKDMTPQQVREAADPQYFRLQDHGDGTATYVTHGRVSETKLVRLYDGSLRMAGNEL